MLRYEERMQQARPWGCSLLFLVVLLWAYPVYSATYYVATGGNDTGTGAARCTRATNSATPLLGINTALTCTGPGDTVQVGAGTFTQRVNLNSTVGGSAGGGVVTLQGAVPLGPTVTPPAGRTILNGTGLGTNVWLMYGRHVPYMTIRNFEITGISGGGIGLFGNTSHVTVTDNYLHDNNATTSALSAIRPTARYALGTNQIHGVEIGTASHVTLARNRIEQWTTGFNETFPTQGTEVMTVVADISQFLIEDNLIIAGHFIGIDMIGKTAAGWEPFTAGHTLPFPPEPWPRQGIIRRNTIKQMRVGYGAADVGIYCDGCQQIVVEENRVEDAPGYCVAMSAEQDQFPVSQLIVRRNIGINCGTAIYGIGPVISTSNPAIHGLSEHLRVAHNTALKTKANGPVYRLNWVPGTRTINNIFAVSAAVKVPYTWHSAGATNTSFLNYNLYHGSPPTESWEYKGVAYWPFATYQSSTGQDAQGLVADPQFTAIATRNLTLQATSPALNRGVALTTTVGAGSGSVVTVADSHWFANGYGMVTGDAVQVGTQPAVVTAVNYGTNQLTLDRALTWTNGLGVTYPYSGSAPDLGACEGVGTCASVPLPPPPPSIPAAVGLRLLRACGTPENSLGARVMGSLLYLAAGATYTADTLAQSQCASTIAITDSASVPGRPLLPPWHFLGTAGPNTSNTCTNCLSVHAGTPSINEAGSGYTLTAFKEGTSVSAATGGVSAYTALPGLCRQVVDGVVTSTPLWPWPMEARIAAARSLAGRPPVNVTQAVEAVLGAIPPACVFTPPVTPPPQTVWMIARPSASPPGVDGAACTVDAPCATAAHVGSRMGSASGQIVYFRAGTYSQRITAGMFPAGTSWTSPTTIAAYGGESVTLQLNTGILIELANPARDRYLVFDGLVVDGSASSSTTTQGLVVSGGAGPIRFQNGAIRNTALERVKINGAQGVELLTSTISGGASLPAITVQGATHGVLVQQLTIEGSPSHGLQFVGQNHTQARVTQTSLRANIGTGIVLDATEILVDNTLLHSNGAGMHLLFGAVANRLSNITIADNTGVGLQIDSGASSTQATNVLLFGNGTELVNTGEDTVLTTTLTTDPGFVGGGDYHLASGASPAMDMGTPLFEGMVARDGTARPQGTGWDIGSFEQAGEPPLPGGMWHGASTFFLVP